MCSLGSIPRSWPNAHLVYWIAQEVSTLLEGVRFLCWAVNKMTKTLFLIACLLPIVMSRELRGATP